MLCVEAEARLVVSYYLLYFTFCSSGERIFVKPSDYPSSKKTSSLLLTIFG